MKNEESIIQQQIVATLSAYSIRNKFFFFSVPNEGFMIGIAGTTKKVFGTLNRLKKMGMVPGMLDLVIIKDGSVFLLEVKSKKGKLSKFQKIIIEQLEKNGAKIAIVRSVKETINKLKEWEIIKDGWDFEHE